MKIPRKTWLYFIVNADNQTITWDALAQMPVVHGVPQPTFIPQNPMGWQDIEISAGTNLKYFSLNRQFATNLKFVNDGANILRWYQYNGRGYDNDLYVNIQQWNRNTGVYELAYKGKLDFITFKDEVKVGVTFDTKEGGVIEFLNANDGIEYEIVCDESNPAAIKVIYDGINLKERFNYSFVEADLDGSPSVIPLAFINNEGDHTGILYGSPVYENIPGALDDYFKSSNNYVVTNFEGTPKTFHIEGILKINEIDTDGDDGIYRLYTQIASTQEFIIPNNNFISIPFPAGGSETPFSFDVTLEAGEKLFIYHQNIFTSPGLSGGIVKYGASDFTISFISRKPQTTGYALTWYDYYKQIVEKMTDGKYTGDSAVLASRLDLVVTCGDALRNTDRAIVPNYKIAGNFSDMFKSMSSILDLALNIVDGVLYIEPKTVVYASDPATEPQIFDLGEIADISIETARDLLINNILCGFPDQDYEERNGKYEFNSEQSWKAPVTLAATQNLDIRSVIRGDCFGIEFIRASFTKLDTTDNSGDKHPFMVQISLVDNPLGFFQAGAEAGFHASEYTVEFISTSTDLDSITLVSNTNVTYIGQQNNIFDVLASLYLTGTDLQVSLLLNSNVMADTFIPVGSGTLVALLAPNVILKQGDIITLHISGDATVEDGTNVVITETINEFNLYRDFYDAISGVFDTTVYNVNFSPKRQILAHAAYLSGLLNQMASDSLKLTSSTKNVELSTTLGGVTISEKADVEISSLLPALFLPYYCLFKCRPQYAFAKTITTINGGYILGANENNQIFLLAFGEMSAKPAMNEVQEWKLLLAPTNNLSNLLRLSQQGLILEIMGNLLFISDLNPVHFIKYDYEPSASYHHLDMYDEWVRKRNERYDTQPNYIQPWQLGDEIKLQFITAYLGAFQLDVKDCEGNTVLTELTAAVADPAVPAPYMLQQVTLTGFPVGKYYIVMSYFGTVVAISEMQQMNEVELAYAYDYYSTHNVLYGYFTNWRPRIRCDSMFMQWQPDSDFENYEDDPGDIELIHANSKRNRQLILGTNDGIGGSGIPDFMMNKMNSILLLNQCNIEGEHYTRTTDSKMEPVQRPGNPFDFYTVQIQKAINEKGLSFTGIPTETENGIISYTFDATGFGMQEGILIAEIDDES